MVAYSQENIEKLETEALTVTDKQLELWGLYLGKKFKNQSAAEFAQHGFARRIKILSRVIENIFRDFSPGREDFPENGEMSDLQMWLHSHVLNTYGCLDNLAWILVSELEITRPNGDPLTRFDVGLKNRHMYVRQALTVPFQDKLKEYDDWFNLVTEFRDALMHQIPLYVPPFVVEEKNHVEYEKLDLAATFALQNGQYDQHDELLDKQKALGKFAPFMMHSLFTSDQKRVFFHPQVLADFNTIHDIGKRVIEELA